MTCGILFLDQGSNSGPLRGEPRALATEPPGKSQQKHCLNAFSLEKNRQTNFDQCPNFRPVHCTLILVCFCPSVFYPLPASLRISFFFLIEVWLSYNIVLALGIQPSVSVFLQVMLHYRLLQYNACHPTYFLDYCKLWTGTIRPAFRIVPGMYVVCAKLLQSCLTLCDSMDCNLLDSSVQGILQARILEWFTMPLCRGSSWPRDRPCLLWLLHCRLIPYCWTTKEALNNSLLSEWRLCTRQPGTRSCRAFILNVKESHWRVCDLTYS